MILPVTKNVDSWLEIPNSFVALQKSIPVSIAVIFNNDIRNVSLNTVSLYMLLCKFQTFFLVS